MWAFSAREYNIQSIGVRGLGNMHMWCMYWHTGVGTLCPMCMVWYTRIQYLPYGVYGVVHEDPMAQVMSSGVSTSMRGCMYMMYIHFGDGLQDLHDVRCNI
jgi:hypothetical protein